MREGDIFRRRCCRSCNNMEFTPIYFVDDQEIGRCETCGLIQNTSHHSLNVINDHYSSKPSARFNAPDSRFELGKIIRACRFRARSFRNITGLTSGRILEIGSNEGDFLVELAKAGFDVLGVEPSAEACQVSITKGVPVINALLEEADLPDAGFDAMCMFQVLEHFEEPRHVLELLWQKLKPGGYLMLETPDIYSLGAKFEKLPHRLFNKEHLTYFSPAQLDRMLAQVGFTPVTRFHYDYDAFRLPFGKSLKKIVIPIINPAFKGPLDKLLLNEIENRHDSSEESVPSQGEQRRLASRQRARDIKKFIFVPLDAALGALAFRMGRGASLVWMGKKTTENARGGD